MYLIAHGENLSVSVSVSRAVGGPCSCLAESISFEHCNLDRAMLPELVGQRMDEVRCVYSKYRVQLGASKLTVALGV